VEEQKKLEEALLMVSDHELAANIRHAHLDTREAKLVDSESQLAEALLQELAAARQRLDELQATRTGEAQKVWGFLGQTEAVLMPLGFNPIRPWALWERLSPRSRWSTLQGQRCCSWRKSSVVSWRQCVVSW
jgi:hypothetical protein